MTGYTVLAGEATATVEIRRSVFTTRLVRVESEQQAREVLAEERARHHDARHHVSAFVLGPDRRTQRSSDDGEPAGTAGTPTLEALTRFAPDGDHPDLSDVVAVTTRWFGGIKLGAGGLVRAYGRAVAEALGSAAFRPRELLDTFTTTTDMARVGHEEALLRAAGVGVEGVTYTADAAVVTLTCPAGGGEDLAARLSSMLGRDVVLTATGSGWVDASGAFPVMP